MLGVEFQQLLQLVLSLVTQHVGVHVGGHDCVHGHDVGGRVGARDAHDCGRVHDDAHGCECVHDHVDVHDAHDDALLLLHLLDLGQVLRD